MSDYLRDAGLKNLVITEDRLTELDTMLREIVTDANVGLAPNDPQAVDLNYILRFDSKGFVLRDLAEVIRHFKNARKVQKLIVAINTNENIALPYMGRFSIPYTQHGKCIYVQLARDEAAFAQGPNFERQIQNMPSYLLVTDDNSGWTEGNFARIKERLDMYKSVSSTVIRAPWLPIALNLVLGVLAFTIALLGALRLSDLFTTSSAPTAIFVLIILVTLPLFNSLQKPLIVLVDHFYPNIAFRELRAHWIIQGILAIATAGALVTLGSLLYSFLATAIHPYLKP